MKQPNFEVGNNQALPSTDFDNLSGEELQRLINSAHKLKTGRSGAIRSTPPPVEKRVVNLEHILGGLKE